MIDECKARHYQRKDDEIPENEMTIHHSAFIIHHSKGVTE